MPKKKPVKSTPKKSSSRCILDPLEVAAALTELDGNVAAVARRFNCNRSTVHAMVESHGQLQQILRDAREGMLDAAENSLLNAARNGEAWAVCFVLKTIGRHRGYIERHEINATETVRREIVEEIVDVTITHQQQQPATGSDPAALGATSVRSLAGPV